jgi:hypothetical protein
MKQMNNTDKALAWVGLAFGGGLSVAGNLAASRLPTLPTGNGADLDAWRKLPTIEASMTSLVAAVAVPFAAVLLVEMLNRWTFLPNLVRRGAIGTVAFIAAAASWVHLFTVMLHEGNHPLIAATVPLIPDTIAIVSAMALLSGVRSDIVADSPDTGQSDTLDEAHPDSLDNGQPDKAPDTIAELDSLDNETAPVDVIPDMDKREYGPDSYYVPVRPRRTRADKAWKADATEMIRNGDPASDQGIAEKIMADADEPVWNTIEAGRKAVARLRASL